MAKMNSTLRTFHIIFAMMMVGTGLFFDDEVTWVMIVGTIGFFGVIITGFWKWPIYPWYKKKKNRKNRALKAEASAEASEEVSAESADA